MQRTVIQATVMEPDESPRQNNNDQDDDDDDDDNWDSEVKLFIFMLAYLPYFWKAFQGILLKIPGDSDSLPGDYLNAAN
jgi:hypothetical protein